MLIGSREVGRRVRAPAHNRRLFFCGGYGPGYNVYWTVFVPDFTFFLKEIDVHLFSTHIISQ